jgi:hypothetical protein
VIQHEKQTGTFHQTIRAREVDAYLKKLKHPLKEVVEALRQIILSTDKEIGEEIKWNAPTFFFSGEIRWWYSQRRQGQRQNRLLQGDYSDGRRLALFPTWQK